MIPESWAPYYSQIIIVFFTFITIVKYAQYSTKNANQVLYGHNSSPALSLVLCCLVILFLGLRPLTQVFGDMTMYAFRFEHNIATEEGAQERLFYVIGHYLTQKYDLTVAFLGIATVYVGAAYAGFTTLFNRNVGVAFVLFVTAFSFASYGINGIRNGFASSLFILGICILLSNLKSKGIILGLGVCLISCLFHKSLSLPLICLIVSFFVRDFKVAIGFWLFSIVIFLVAQGPVSSFFMALGFDDRLSHYVNTTESYAAKGLKTGFRPDFLLYSAMPILLGYVVQVKHGIKNRAYQLLINTYVFSNAFWCMLMGVAYSNRFAYLSWFLYPLVLAYPCLKMNVWGDKQGLVAARIMLANTLFTLFMDFIYY